MTLSPTATLAVKSAAFPFVVAPNTTATPKDRFSPLPNLFVDAILPQLTGNAMKVYCYLQRHADRKSARVVRSVDEIAAGCGCGRATAWRALQQLVSLSVVTPQARWGYDGTHQRAARVRNAYTLTAPDAWVMSAPVNVSRPPQNEHAPAQNVSKSAENEHANTNAVSNAHKSNNKQRARKIETPAPSPVGESVVVSSVHETATAPDAVTRLTAAPAKVTVENATLSERTTSNATAHKSGLSAQQQDLLAQMEAIGVTPNMARVLLRDHDATLVETQLRVLDAREPRDAAATLVKSIRKNWGAPAAYAAQQEAAQRATDERARRIQDEARQAREKAAERAKMAQGEAEAAQLDKLWLGLDAATRERIEAAAQARLLPLMRGEGARRAMCRTLLQQWLDTGTLGESGGLI